MTPHARKAWLESIATEHAGPEARAWLAAEGAQPDLDGRVRRPPFRVRENDERARETAVSEMWRLDFEGETHQAAHAPATSVHLDDLPPPPSFDDGVAPLAETTLYGAARLFDERIPHLRVGVALAVDTDGLADTLRPHFLRCPGFDWEVVPLPGMRPDVWSVDVVVCPESANARLPRAVTALREEVAAAQTPLLFFGTSLGVRDAADPHASLPARIAALHVHALQSLHVEPPETQLSFPFSRFMGLDNVRLPPIGPTVSASRLPHGVRLHAVYDDGATRSVSLELGPHGAVVQTTEPFASRDALRLRWLASTRDADPDDLFGAFADSIAGRGLPCRALLDPLVRRARIWLRQAVPRTARSAARDFHPRVAISVAMRVAADATGRVAQLARVCPGVFALGVSLRASTALDEVCARTIAGERLARCLEPVLEAWRRAGSGPRDVARHATFVKRAPAPLDPDALREPFPEGLVLDDLPAETAARTAWFIAAGTLAARSGCGSAKDANALAPFVSARGAAIGELDADARACLFAGLVQRGRTLGHWPARNTELAAARQRIHGFANDDERLAWIPTLTPPTNPRLDVRVLASPAELAAEGERMGHCVASYTPDVLRREMLVFSVEWESARYTASAIVLPDDTLALAEVQGRHNLGPPPPALVTALARWLAIQRLRAAPQRHSPGRRSTR